MQSGQTLWHIDLHIRALSVPACKRFVTGEKLLCVPSMSGGHSKKHKLGRPSADSLSTHLLPHIVFDVMLRFFGAALFLDWVRMMCLLRLLRVSKVQERFFGVAFPAVVIEHKPVSEAHYPVLAYYIHIQICTFATVAAFSCTIYDSACFF